MPNPEWILFLLLHLILPALLVHSVMQHIQTKLPFKRRLSFALFFSTAAPLLFLLFNVLIILIGVGITPDYLSGVLGD